MMKPWRITWEDTQDQGYPEHLIGTKMLRYVANYVAARSPDREFLWTKEVYPLVAAHFLRDDPRTVERNIRTAIAAADGKDSARTVVQAIYELAAVGWERRQEQGVDIYEEEEVWI